ncbi:MAG: T9SS type A sorting domain-containing protein [Cyclobacteriaceae bacterium]|nr:T9SS type A sorting domain-containing protein [Cyclobacteriaceae bacterium]
MKRSLLLSLITTLFLFEVTTYAQNSRKPPVIICPASYISSNLRIPAPPNFLENVANARTASSENAHIIVTYHGFDDNPEAQEAFQYAVDIWASILHSDVPIYLDAKFSDLGSGVLGSAGTTLLLKDFDGAPNDSTWFNIALAEKIAGKDLNIPGEPDISASFSSTANWYLGTDGNTPSSQHDFVTVVLHEIGHGLGFFALDSFDDSNNSGTRNPGAYDNYIINGNGTMIYELPNNSTELGDFLTSSNLFINSPSTVSLNGGFKAKIYAPSTYNSGSSISHWDDNTFDGTQNALMTHAIATGESIHDPGPNMMGLFTDMGWINTRLKHHNKLIVNSLTDAIPISVTITTDTTLTMEQPVLHYSYDDFVSQTDQMLNDDGNGTYSFSIPNPGVVSTLKYYISGVTDALGRGYTAPSNGAFRYTTLIRNESPTSLPYTLADGGDFETPSDFEQVSLKGDVQIWQQGIPGNTLNTPSSGTQVWKTNLNKNISQPSSDYASALISPMFDMSDTTADYNLQFDLSMDVDVPAMGFSVFYSIDGGSNWLELGKPDDPRGVNWMNSTENYLLFESGNAWIKDNTDDMPQTVSYNLSDIIGDGESEVYFALVASVTNAYNDEVYDFDGIMIDNFEITKSDPKATFYVDTTKINFPNKAVQFTYISKGAQTFNWDFGDGESSSEKNPAHSYGSGGIYNVALTITYPTGSDTYTLGSAIKVIEARGSTYTLDDGGNMESNFDDFLVDNISGTPFELGESSIEGKNGTASGTHAWVTGIDSTEYEDRSEAYLYTPLFDFSLFGSYEFSFKANYSLEEGWDGFIVEYTLNNGETWEQLDPENRDGWYDKTGEDNEEQGWPAIPLFTGTTNGDFVLKTTDLSDFSGMGKIGFRFHFKSDYASVDVGVAIDDVELVGPTPGPGVPDFTFEGNTGCDGQVVTFTNVSTGSITSLEWDFGANASPATATGGGPIQVIYSGSVLSASSVKLTVESPENGVQSITKTDIISTAPLHEASFTEEVVNGNTAQSKLTASNGDAFQWYLRDEPIEGATEQTYVTDVKGFYSVDVDIDGCVVNSGRINIITSVDQKALENKASIYPNPANNKFRINLSNEYLGDVLVEMYNMNGALTYSGSFYKESRNSEFEVTTNGFMDGVYLIKLQFADRIETTRLILEK